MSHPIDYSRWKDIEVSDDEDDTHPNIDTPSLFRWRHQARVERQKEFDDKKANAVQKQKQVLEEKKKLQETLKNDSSDMGEIKKSLSDIEKKEQDVTEKLKAVEKEERLRPWNVDTISHSGFSKTVMNKDNKNPAVELTDEEKDERMRDFVKKNKEEMDKYSMFQKFDDSKRYLNEHKHLACEETANYLVIQCINYAMEEKFNLMDHVSHQTIAMQYLLELAKQLDIDPRACIGPFFSKIQIANDDYKKTFYDELESFKQRVRRRAKEKIEQQIREMKESGELPKDEPPVLGPGGLDPSEVFQSLPEVLQKCFESQDIASLQEAIKQMPEAEARLHMKRCIDSGLWVPSKDDPNTNPEDGFKKKLDGKEDSESEADEDEPIYNEATQQDNKEAS